MRECLCLPFQLSEQYHSANIELGHCRSHDHPWTNHCSQRQEMCWLASPWSGAPPFGLRVEPPAPKLSTRKLGALGKEVDRCWRGCNYSHPPISTLYKGHGADPCLPLVCGHTVSGSCNSLISLLGRKQAANEDLLSPQASLIPSTAPGTQHKYLLN